MALLPCVAEMVVSVARPSAAVSGCARVVVAAGQFVASWKAAVGRAVCSMNAICTQSNVTAHVRPGMLAAPRVGDAWGGG